MNQKKFFLRDSLFMSNLKAAIYDRTKPMPASQSGVGDDEVELDIFKEILEPKCNEEIGGEHVPRREFSTFEEFFVYILPFVQETMVLESAESAFDSVKQLYHIHQNRKTKRKRADDDATQTSPSKSTSTVPASTETCFDTSAVETSPIDASPTIVAAKKPKASPTDDFQFGFKSLETWDDYVLDAVLSMGVFPQQPILRREKIALVKQYLVA